MDPVITAAIARAIRETRRRKLQEGNNLTAIKSAARQLPGQTYGLGDTISGFVSGVPVMADFKRKWWESDSEYLKRTKVIAEQAMRLAEEETTRYGGRR